MVVVSDPAMIQRIIGWQDEVQKSVDMFYSQFNIVRARHSCRMSRPPKLLHVGVQHAIALPCMLQLARDEEVPNMFTSTTNDWWRLIRKSLAPAFAAANLRHVPTGHTAQLDSMATLMTLP